MGNCDDCDCDYIFDTLIECLKCVRARIDSQNKEAIDYYNKLRLSMDIDNAREFIDNVPTFREKNYVLCKKYKGAGKLREWFTTYFTVPCDKIKRFSANKCTFKIKSKLVSLIFQNFDCILPPYVAKYLCIYFPIHSANFYVDANKISLENVCAIELKLVVKYYGRYIKKYYERYIKKYYVISQLYRKFDLNQCFSLKNPPRICYPLAQVCEKFGAPAEIMRQIARYITIIRREDYRSRAEINRTKTLPRIYRDARFQKI